MTFRLLVVCSADTTFQDHENLPSCRVQKLDYMVDLENFVNLIAPFMGNMTFPVDGQLRRETAWKEWMIPTRIDMAGDSMS